MKGKGVKGQKGESTEWWLNPGYLHTQHLFFTLWEHVLHQYTEQSLLGIETGKHELWIYLHVSFKTVS